MEVGAVVSYFEWVQDISWLFWTEQEVRQKLREIMINAFTRVWNFTRKYQSKKDREQLKAFCYGYSSFAIGKSHEAERADLINKPWLFLPASWTHFLSPLALKIYSRIKSLEPFCHWNSFRWRHLYFP